MSGCTLTYSTLLGNVVLFHSCVLFQYMAISIKLICIPLNTPSQECRAFYLAPVHVLAESYLTNPQGSDDDEDKMQQ